MSDTAEAPRARCSGPLSQEFEPQRWAGDRHGPPLPVKILAVAAAFWLFHPLGVALLVYFLWRAARGHGGGFRGGPFRARRNGAAPSRRPSSDNTAFEERRQETLKALDAEAEAFDAFERGRREAEDREAFERFAAGRKAQKGEAKTGDEPPK